MNESVLLLLLLIFSSFFILFLARLSLVHFITCFTIYDVMCVSQDKNQRCRDVDVYTNTEGISRMLNTAQFASQGYKFNFILHLSLSLFMCVYIVDAPITLELHLNLFIQLFFFALSLSASASSVFIFDAIITLVERTITFTYHTRLLLVYCV